MDFFIFLHLKKFVTRIPVESIVDILGTIRKSKPTYVSQASVEICIQNLFVVSRASSSPPFFIEDASISRRVINYEVCGMGSEARGRGGIEYDRVIADRKKGGVIAPNQ